MMTSGGVVALTMPVILETFQDPSMTVQTHPNTLCCVVKHVLLCKNSSARSSTRPMAGRLRPPLGGVLGV